MHDLYKQDNLPYMAVKLCPHCQKLIKVDSNQCPHCYYNFQAKVVMKQENTNLFVSNVPNKFVINKKPVEKEIKEVKEVKEVKDVKEPERFVFCEHCGSKIVGQQRFCSSCGTRASKRICQACHQVIDSNLAFCPLCGEKQEGVVPSQVVTNDVVGQNTQDIVNPAPVLNPITDLNNSNVDNKENDTVVVNKPVDDNVNTNDNNVKNNDDEFESPSDCINMGRKRLFIIIQLIITALVATLMVMVPIITKDSLFASLLPSFSGELEGAKMTFIDLVNGLIASISDVIAGGEGFFNEADPLYALVNVEGNYIFSSMPFVSELVSMLEALAVPIPGFFVSLVAVTLVYFLIALSMVIIFFSSIVGFFRKRPFKGKAMGFLVITLFIGCLIVYLGSIIGPYNGYDSWLLYGFALTFLIWFIIKLVFGKEARLYKRLKRAEKK